MGLALVEDTGACARDDAFQEWRTNLIELARRPNVYCKIGRLGTSYWGFGFEDRIDLIGYLELADVWRPYVEVAIAAFGADRCMMASNYPNDGRSCGFVPLWNALKHIFRDYSNDEKAGLFHKTAIAVYRIDLPGHPTIG